MNISITGIERAGEALRARVDRLKGDGLRRLHLAMITEVQHVTERHLLTLANTRHASAQKVAADPSGHLAEAATKVAQADLSASDSEAALAFSHPGMGRAFHDVTIRKPGGMIALPLNAAAYARSPRQIWDSSFFIIRKNGRVLILKKDGDAKPIAMYLLVRSVHQIRDRSLLPSAEEWRDAANLGANRYVFNR
jgi:hypothetical protein